MAPTTLGTSSISHTINDPISTSINTNLFNGLVAYKISDALIASLEDEKNNTKTKA